MIIVRQSTARTVMVGPVLDASGVAVTDGVVGDLKISKNGAAPAALNGSATLTHRHTGHYSLALTTSDLDTVGQAEVVMDDTVNAMPTKELQVIEEAVYDALFVASALGYVANAPVNVAQFGGSNGTFSSGRPEVNTSHAAGTAWGSGAITAASIASDAITAAKIADGAIDAATFAAGAIDAAAIAADAITAAKVAADVTTEIQSGLATAANLATVDTVVDAIKAVTDLLPDAGALTSLATAAALTTVDTVVDAVKVETDKLADTLEDQGGGVYGFTAPALQEAPAGGAGLDAAGVRAAVGLASANLDTQLGAIDNFVDDLETDLGTVSTALDAVLALLDDARTEPGQGAPAANAALATKIDYLYAWARNKKTNDGSITNYYADDGSTVAQKQTTSEAAGTVTIGEMATGA